MTAPNLDRWLERPLVPLLERLQLLGQAAAPQAWSGRYRARSKGRSLEYAGFREYAPGDDPRTLDWQALARLDRPYVREYQAERERAVTLLVDGSASMVAGDKGDTALELAAALGYCALHHGDRLEVVLLEGPRALALGGGRGRAARHRLAVALAAAADRMAGQRAARFLQSGRPAGDREGTRARTGQEVPGEPTAARAAGGGPPVTTALRAALQRWQAGPGGEQAHPGAPARPAWGPPRRGSLAILISDLLDPGGIDSPAYCRQVAALLAAAGQGALIHLLDLDDRVPPPGEWTLVDAETGTTVEVTVDESLLARYRQAVARWAEGWRRACHAQQVLYVAVPAPAPARTLIAGHLVPAGLLG
ncbi:DUF58 domain-containing protein [Thermaerobacter sp. PB12/4term]|uniref:DUF58 domain-containing protein n=1 Tax=Thermaerobacter sp. PB12/4term TaxID=2293838 RepID=UPI000E325CE5|nr:DUF58 domain-containing protein [Thermaerobacter sp. PB12/4term]QIA27693.1 DUF58 domain-containing protein [Thermaerobacter sp. PB12/4term]